MEESFPNLDLENLQDEEEEILSDQEENSENSSEFHEILDDLNPDEDKTPIELLITAIEEKNFQEIQKILRIFPLSDSKNSQKIDVNELIDDESFLVDLAWREKNFELVQILLEANSKFPKDFNLDEFVHFGLKNFAQNMEKVHEFVKTDNLGGVKRVVGEYLDKKKR